MIKELQPWAVKHLERNEITIPTEKMIEQAFTSKVLECDFLITNVNYFHPTQTLTITAVGHLAGETDDYVVRLQFPQPKVPRTKDLSTLIGGKVTKLNPIAQYTNTYKHRAILTCYATIITEARKLNVSSSNENEAYQAEASENFTLKEQHVSHRSAIYRLLEIS